MKNLSFIITCSLMMLFLPGTYAQLTTSGITGEVTAPDKQTLPGASVLLIHEPTGTSYASSTNASGIFNLSNLNPGGPYTLTISYIGFFPYKKEDIRLNLGQNLRINISLAESSSELEEILVIGAGVQASATTTGSKTTVSNERINTMPSISRGISDIARLSPQARVNSSGGLEIAGQNSKYNSFTIDGAVQNDVFGLASSGTNGGQIGINPMSMDIIDQITITLSPYDVTQSGFSGAGINAVTKSGTNTFSGSVYDYYRNEQLAGKTPTDNDEFKRTRLDEFTSNTTGFTLGGPLLKNKLFFFTNVEIQRDKTPKPYDFSTYTGSATKSELEALESKMGTDYGYNPGSFENTEEKLDAEKFFVKVDWNISPQHKFSIRHQYSKGKSLSPGTSSTTSIYFSNTGIDFVSTTNSTTAELKSIFANKYANRLMLGYTNVDDNRDPMGDPFPYVYFTSEKIGLGSEQYSTANRLKQKVFSFTDNFSIYAGKHNIILGMHHEYYDFFNVFIRQNYGYYAFASLADFMAGNPATRYQRTFSNVDEITGDGTSAAAEFKFLQLGFYAQDELQLNDRLSLTYGLRIDIPKYLDDPRENTDFNKYVIPYLETQYAVNFKGARTGKAPGATALFSPRLGFDWDIRGDKSLLLHGGMGLFTSRIPFVWPGGMFNNNGMTVGAIDVKTSGSPELVFNPDWDKQPSVQGSPSGQIDLFAENFKMPQVFRSNLALDRKLDNGISATIDLTFTKNVNNVTYQNLFIRDLGKKMTGTGDNRTIWTDINSDVDNNSGASGKYTDVYLGSNTSKGHSFNLMVQADKKWENGLFASLAYNYGRAKSINDGESSQNSSQWRVANAHGRNRLNMGYSVYDPGHRILVSVSYKWEYSNFANTTFSVFYNGQSGQTYSYGYDNGVSAYAGPAGDNTDGKDLSLIYIPENQGDIILVDDDAYTAAQQWSDLSAFIEDHKSLKEHKGEYFRRGSERLPFENVVDLKVMQEFKFRVSPTRQNRIQIALDIFNFTNLLNKDWGRMHYADGDYNVFPILKFAGYRDDGTTPTYTYCNKKGNDTWGIDDSGLQSSRWQAQFSIRYIF
ncbi:MAG: carboxypeptidase regulatory-like domain-containing protein [Mangrovibacterium sp.]